MPYAKLIQVLKGSAYSGNWHHSGRPGKLGGSASGGGYARLGFVAGVDRSKVSSDTIKRLSYISRTQGKYKKVSNDKELIDHYDLKANCGPKIDCGALTTYTGFYYDYINSSLRGRYVSDYDLAQAKQYITNIDKTFENAPATPYAMTVYRGANPDLFKNLQPGDEFLDKGYTSTSITTSGAFSGLSLEIRVPKGTKGIYVKEISMHAHEAELLLNRGTRFKILNVEKDTTPQGTDVATKVLMEVIND